MEFVLAAKPTHIYIFFKRQFSGRRYFLLIISTPLLGALRKIDRRLSHEAPTEDCGEEERNPAYRESVGCKIFLGFTSNLVSSGIREIIRFLVQHRMVISSLFIEKKSILLKTATYLELSSYIMNHDSEFTND